MTQIRELVHTWNEKPADTLRTILIEDDSLRDGLQGAYTRRPGPDEKKEILRSLCRVGVQRALVGFPAISEREYEECLTLCRAIRDEGMPIKPKFLSRALSEDIEPIIRLRDETGLDVWVDFWIAASPLRTHVEGWELDSLIARVKTAAAFLTKNGISWAFSLEDSSRTPPAIVDAVYSAVIDNGAHEIVVCDTCGDSTPSGTTAIIKHVRALALKKGFEGLVSWHGHNDRGLGVANSIAAGEAGVNVLSGSFLGIGERTGCTALEQIIMLLASNGSTLYNTRELFPLCEQLSKAVGVPIPDAAPLVGRQAFATHSGTHVSAILKGRKLGREFEDLVYSSVAAADLGREQVLLLGPTSGIASAKYVLESLDLEYDDQLARKLLAHAKSGNAWLSADEIRRFQNEQ
jgi:isopropylmalate/homocitrate/citramalate synthase